MLGFLFISVLQTKALCLILLSYLIITLVLATYQCTIFSVGLPSLSLVKYKGNNVSSGFGNAAVSVGSLSLMEWKTDS